MPSPNVVIVQAPRAAAYAPSSSSSAAPNSPSSSIFYTSSSGTSYYASNASDSSGNSSNFAPHTSATRPAELIAMTPNGQREFVYTGRPQGGNPNGGPARNPHGYERVITGDRVIVHNTGGQLRSATHIKDGPYGNDETHSEACREKSRRSDNQSLCFCPPANRN